MAKTGQQIEDDVYETVKTGPLASVISGGVYKYGTRPRDSKKEDIIVKFVSGSGGEDPIQSGTVVVNIYVPDLDPYENGVSVRDISRCTEIENAANDWVKSLTANKSNYLFRTVQTIYTEEAAEINQHFVSVKLRFRLTTF
ncbi:MAG: hypothetical protein FWF53_03385 [Candidatus Azobacteroides sp.]|nr:hypothetical protein [Candidatus Azobacteroides sp.]